MNHSPTTRNISRQLLVAWCIWLLLSWAVNLAIDPPLMGGLLNGDHVSEFAERMTPAVRGMLMSVMIGLGLVWPAVRLSQSPIGGAGLINDWLGLMLVCQIVVWPMKVMLDWSLGRTLAMDLQVAAWSAAAGVAVWLATQPGVRGVGRSAAMLICVVLVMGGLPAAAWTGDLGFASWSPLHALWTLAGDTDSARITEATVRAGVVAGAAAAAVALATWRARPMRD